MAYSGPIDTKLAGLYLSRYKDDQGRARFALSSATTCEQSVMRNNC